jgi:hypothetical protein
MTEALGAEVLRNLKSAGFAHIKQPVSFETFESIATEMGTIELVSEIRIDDGHAQQLHQTRKVKTRPSPYQADALGFHSDNPRMDVLGWYCFEQDDNTGATLLIDTSDLPSYLAAEDLAGLCETNLWYSVRSPESDEEQLFQIPLVIRKDTECYVYYQPWLFLDTYDAEQTRVLQSFSDYLAYKQRTQTISVKLERQQCLFIDNRRILHGRDAIAGNSRRHLRRFFIRTYRDLRS